MALGGFAWHQAVQTVAAGQKPARGDQAHGGLRKQKSAG
jgi:hypothetical protein